MKKIIILILFSLSFIFDVVFFNYDLSDIKHIKADISEINNRIDKSLELIVPFYFDSIGFEIKNCSQLSSHSVKPTNLFEKEVLKELNNKCKLKKVLELAKFSQISFVENIKLKDLENWNKELYFDFNCNGTKFSDFLEYKNFNNGRDLEKNNIIKIISRTDKNIIFTNNVIGRMFFVKEIFRANFGNDKNKDILLEISVSNPDNNFIECTNYVVFTKNSKNSLMKEKILK